MHNELTILCYHGVTNSVSTGIENHHAKHIHVDAFYAQMKYLKEHCTVFSMDEIVELKNSNTSYPSNAVAITFDDGFRNNFSVAAPVLNEFNLPATFYITAGIVNTSLMFWVDELEDCINHSTVNKIRLSIGEFDLHDDERKIVALETIKQYCKTVPSKQKDEIVEAVKLESGIFPSVDHAQNYQKIKWNELQQMSNDPLFTIGGHSMYHDILANLPHERMKADIELSLKLLSSELNSPVIHYAYPEGQADHYNSNVIQVLKENRIVCCPSAIHGTNDETVDLFDLRRILVGFKGAPFPFSKQTVQTLTHINFHSGK
jgi:peptidoglycan/xylan/chitin deacetylase (PgdA/CDA1 family)